MSTSDTDIRAVRELADELHRPASLARSWQIITARQRPRRRRGPRYAVPVAAGLAVLLAVGVAWLARPAGRGHTVGDLPAEGVPVPVAQAWAALIAAAPSAPAVSIPDGSVIYVRSTGQGARIVSDGSPWPMEDQNRQAWFDPDGMRLLLIRDDDRVLGDGEKGQTPGPDPVTGNLTHPTPAWLAGLPTDPDALGDLLIEGSDPAKGDWSARHGLWEAMANLFSTADLAVPPAVRAAMYRVLADEKGLGAARIIVGGREVYAISRVERDDVQQLLFDPATGRCVGRRSLYLGDDPGRPANGVLSWALWQQQALVSRVDETP